MICVIRLIYFIYRNFLLVWSSKLKISRVSFSFEWNLRSSLLAVTAAVFTLQCWSVTRQSCLVCDHQTAQLYVRYWCLEGGRWAGCNCFFQSSQGPCRHLAGASFLLLHARRKEPETHRGRNWFWRAGVLITAEIPLSPLSYTKSSVNAVMLLLSLWWGWIY